MVHNRVSHYLGAKPINSSHGAFLDSTLIVSHSFYAKQIVLKR